MPPLLRQTPSGGGPHHRRASARTPRGLRRRVDRLRWRDGITASFWVSVLIYLGIGALALSALFSE
ncbi:MAG: hypothetical protein QM736_26800 [Vicinamibacterales bacterium]